MIKGTFAIPNSEPWGEPVYEPVFPSLNRPLKEALNHLNLSSEDVKPCQESPEEWDTQPVNVGHGTNWTPEPIGDYLKRAQRSIDLCIGECTAFAQCQNVVKKLNKVNPEITGIIAGVLIDPSTAGLSVNRKLKDVA
jgi:hypothetical protein